MKNLSLPGAEHYRENDSHYHQLSTKYSHNGQPISLELLEPKLEYADLSVNWLRNPEVGRYMGASFSGKSSQELLKEIDVETERRRLENILIDDNEYHWMIACNSQIIGNVNVNCIKEKSKQYRCKAGSLSILIGNPNFWGKGIAESTLRTVLNWAFHKANFKLLHARIQSENRASLKCFERLGAQFSSTEVEQLNGKNILWQNYLITNEKWDSDQTKSPNFL